MTTSPPPAPRPADSKPAPAGTPAPPPPRSPYLRRVQVLAIVNSVWVVLGVALLSTGTNAVFLGYLLLPQAVVVSGVPWLAGLISAAAVLASIVYAAVRRRSPHGVPFEFFAAGTFILTASLIAGPLFLLTMPLLS